MTDLEAVKDAIERDDFDSVAAMLESDSQLATQTDAIGATALHYAALRGRRRIARFLVERGADINRRDGKFDATPAGWAIEYLRELGGHLSIELQDLAYAIETRDVPWVKRFLTRFPEMRTTVYRDEITFRQLAADSSDKEIADLFADDPTLKLG
jgi:ankyrin repeat protein